MLPDLTNSVLSIRKWIFIPTICTDKRLFVHTYVPISGYLYLRLEHIGKYADWQHQYDSRVVRSAVSRGEYSVVNERA